jgi:hypothetical protein
VRFHLRLVRVLQGKEFKFNLRVFQSFIDL